MIWNRKNKINFNTYLCHTYTENNTINLLEVAHKDSQHKTAALLFSHPIQLQQTKLNEHRIALNQL